MSKCKCEVAKCARVRGSAANDAISRQSRILRPFDARPNSHSYKRIYAKEVGRKKNLEFSKAAVE